MQLLLNFQGGQKSCGLFAKIELFSKPTQNRSFKGPLKKSWSTRFYIFSKIKLKKWFQSQDLPTSQITLILVQMIFSNHVSNFRNGF
jgi:hypothetical protein